MADETGEALQDDDLGGIELAVACAKALDDEEEVFTDSPEALELEPRFQAAVAALADETSPVSEVLLVDLVGLSLGAPRRDGSPGDRAERNEPHAREEAYDQVEEVHVRRSVAPAPRGVKRRVSGSAEQGQHLVLLREAPLALFGEDEAPVRDDVVLAPLALDGGCLVPCVGQRGRETRGPNVVAVSDGAVEDLDPHDGHLIRAVDRGLGRARAWLRFVGYEPPEAEASTGRDLRRPVHSTT